MTDDPQPNGEHAEMGDAEARYRALVEQAPIILDDPLCKTDTWPTPSRELLGRGRGRAA
jgi:hypothetical protein